MPKSKPKLLVACNVDWFYISHRSNIFKGLNFLDFIVSCEITQKNSPDYMFDIGISRRFSIFTILLDFMKVLSQLLQYKPILVHAITIKPILLYGILSRILGFKFIGSISGLGPAFKKNNIKTNLLIYIYKFIFKEATAIVQSDHDYSFMVKVVNCPNVIKAPGSGVKVDSYNKIKKFNEELPITFVFSSRLLFDKGVKVFIDAAVKFLKHYPMYKFVITGPFDSSSPTSIPVDVFNNMIQNTGIKYLGNVDIPSFFSQNIIFIFPTFYPEGIPKVLLEALASGLPIITTDHPGCNDVIQDNYNGLLVKPNNVESLLEKMHLVHNNFELINRLSENAFSSSYFYDESLIIKIHHELYKTLIY